MTRRDLAKALLVHKAKVYIAARNEAKARQVIQELKMETGKEALFLQLDLANLKAVKRCAEEFLR
jgi:retinol dehydrogenase 12